MFKINKFLLIILIVFFVGCYNVSAKECYYKELDLKVVDGKIEGGNWDNLKDGAISLITSTYLPGKVNFSTPEEIDSDVQNIFDNDRCAKNIKACVYTSFSVKLRDAIIGDLSFQDLLKNLIPVSNDNLKIEWKKVLYNKANFDSSSYKEIEDNGGWLVSDTTHEAAKKAGNVCSSVPVVGQFTGALCQWAVDISGRIHVSPVNTYLKLKEGETLYFNTIYCKNGKSDDPDAVDGNCGQLTFAKEDFAKLIDKYKNCKNDAECKANTAALINDTEYRIKNICSFITNNFNYDDFQSECLDDCIKIGATLNDYKKGTDLYNGLNKNKKCYMSDRLIKWISNIFKWAKYIGPVLVIILGILDFIKAIASQSDDEMKKAQGRFVKRLISAALLYLVPYLIEFAFDAFNLVSDYCDII